MSTVHQDVMLPSEVASMFGVSGKTVVRWAETGLLPYFRTLGGHRRFRRADVEALYTERQRS